jgi:hypothetical protein
MSTDMILHQVQWIKIFLGSLYSSLALTCRSKAWSMEPARKETISCRIFYSRYIIYNKYALVSQSESTRISPLFFLSYLYTRKSKEKRGNQKEYNIPIVIPMSFGLNIGLSDSVHLHPLSLSWQPDAPIHQRRRIFRAHPGPLVRPFIHPRMIPHRLCRCRYTRCCFLRLRITTREEDFTGIHGENWLKTTLTQPHHSD